MKILYITYYWPPAGGPGVQRAVKFAKFLPEFNITPIILTVDEKAGSYPLKDYSLEKDIDSSLRVLRTSTFEPLGFYSKLLKKEVPYSGFVNESNPTFTQKLSRFIRGNLFIPDARRGWNSFAIREAKKLIKEEKIDAVVTSSPPHSTQLIGLRLKEIFDIPWIADLRDPWTDIYYYNLMLHTPIAKYLDQKYERKVLEKADAILVTNDDTKSLFAAKSPLISKEKIQVIYNGFDEADFDGPNTKREEEFCLTYTGTIASNYNTNALIEALHQFHAIHPDKKIKIRFVGKVSQDIKERFKLLNGCVEYIPYVPHRESISYLKSSAVLLLVIPEVKNNEAILPGKLFEYLAARRPIICLGPANGDVAKIIRECQTGNTFQPEGTTLLLQYLNELFERWQKGGKSIELSGSTYLKYSRKAQSEKLAILLRTMRKI